MRQNSNNTAAAGTRQRLVEAMSELMWTKGYSSVSVEDICKAAGAQKGSFYHFFASKAELATVVCETAWESYKLELDEIFSPTRPALQRFTRFHEVMYQEQQEKTKELGYVVGCPFCTIGSELATQDENVRERIEAIFEAHLRYFENAIRDAAADGSMPKNTDVKSMAREVDALMTGAMATARIKNSLEPMGKNLLKAVFHCLGVAAPVGK